MLEVQHWLLHDDCVRFFLPSFLPELLGSILEEYGGPRLRNDKEVKGLGETANNQLYPEYPTPIQVLLNEGT
jgi:hypothetical protein